MKAPLFLFILILLFSSLVNAQDIYSRPIATPKPTPLVKPIKKQSPALITQPSLSRTGRKAEAPAEIRKAEAATEECKLTLEESPAVLGGALKLGMSVDEVKPLLLSSKIMEGIVPGQSQAIIKNTANTKSVYISFFDNKIYKISITYNDEVKWDSLEELVSEISEKLTLPKKSWRSIGFLPSLTCKGFEVNAWQINEITISDTIADESVTRRFHEELKAKEEKEKAKKKEFKP